MEVTHKADFYECGADTQICYVVKSNCAALKASLFVCDVPAHVDDWHGGTPYLKPLRIFLFCQAPELLSIS
jgi:hypothetical protein